MNDRSTQPNDDSFPFAGLFASLLVVAIIVGAMSFGFFLRQQTRRLSALGDISVIHGVLPKYIAECGGPPTEAQGLAALIRNPGVNGWSGPYLPAQIGIMDPWGMRYQYVVLGGLPIVSSAGPDGVFGTPDDLWWRQG